MFLKTLLLLVCSSIGSLAISGDDYTFSKIYKLREFNLEFYNKLTSLNSVVENENFDLQCLKQIQAIQNGLQLNQLWSIKFIDAWGKIPSGILQGNNVELGNYDECLGIMHNISNLESTIRGKYCLATISIDKIERQTLRLQMGICIPTACLAEQLRQPMEAVLKKLMRIDNKNATDNSLVFLEDSKCSTADVKPFEAIDWAAIYILSILALSMIASTIYDYVTTQNGNKVHPLWASFSVRANMRQLFNIDTFNNTPHNIPCLHGLRCISIIWVILIHSFLFMTFVPAINSNDLDNLNRSLSANLWQNFICVDTFFFLSGILVVMTAYRQMEKNAGVLNVKQMYLHRILRLTPVLAMALLLHMSITRYMDVGPLSPYKKENQCADNWWLTLLYVQNYAIGMKMCLPHSWYLAADMQLYFISPLILMAIWKWKKKALVGLLLIGLVLSIKLIFTVVMENMSVLKIMWAYPDTTDVLDVIYIPTHTRTAPWIIGIVLGYYLYHYEGKKGKHTTLSKLSITIGWLCSVCIILAVKFSMHSSKLDAYISPLKSGLYLSLSHIGWGMAMAWIVFACVNGFAGPINDFLSCPLWQPLSKLSYCLYIFHIAIVYINMNRIKTTAYLSNYDAILHFWQEFGVSLMVSLVIYIAVELPVLNIDKFLFPSRTSHKPVK